MTTEIEKHSSRIAKIRQETELAENQGSAKGMSNHFAPDVVMLAPNMPAVSGAENVTNAMNEFFDTFEFEIHYTSEEIVILGSWAFDRGTYHHKLGLKGVSDPVEESGKYIWLYSLDSEDSWKQSRIMWNSSDELQANDT